MDPINRLDQVMQVIGRQMSERAARLETSGASARSVAPVGSARRPSLAALRSKVQARLQSIDPHDPRRPERARRVFLESVLAWQFGDALLLDRGFADIVAGVQEALQAHPQADARLDQLLAELSA